MTIRTATSRDDAAVASLLADALNWGDDEPLGAFLEWKHSQNPFGVSAAWIAEVEGQVVGYRAFLRWEFKRGDEEVRAVRAVDTATHPEFRRQGIFEQLTRHALDELQAEGVRFVFNTPNSRSRPGYLKMGWREIGRLPIAVRSRSLRAMKKIATARLPAGRWPASTDVGTPIDSLFEDEQALVRLLQRVASREMLETVRTPQYLRWRYGNPSLAYRCMVANSVEDGVAIFRIRSRGQAIELTLCELLVPEEDARAKRSLARDTLAASKADYLIALRQPGRLFDLGIPLPRQGPILTWRDLTTTDAPPLDQWRLTLGDIELF